MMSMEGEIRNNMVCEMFSPPRLVPLAAKNGFMPGWSMDIGSVDPFTGRTWDLSRVGDQKHALDLIEKH